MFNGLVQLDSLLNVKPSISKSWSVSSDLLVYTFILRDDVFFHDHKLFKEGMGRKVIASDFEYSFSRIIDKDLAALGCGFSQMLDLLLQLMIVYLPLV